MESFHYLLSCDPVRLIKRGVVDFVNKAISTTSRKTTKRKTWGMPGQERLGAPGMIAPVIVRGIDKIRIEDCGIPLAGEGGQLGVSSSAVYKIIRRS